MKYVYLEPEPSIAMGRVRDALVNYLPSRLKIVHDMDDADFVVLHVNGRRDRNERTAKYLVERGKKYAVIQYCVRSTQRAMTRDWVNLWRGASVVWSYLDLPSLLAEDGEQFELRSFYYSPLGVSREFNPTATMNQRSYIIGTSGRSWLTESVREAAAAAQLVGGRVFHLGPCVTDRPHVVCLQGMSDRELSKLWASCLYVSGLRRTEGFEFPAAEGLICGARPVLFDRPHYKNWYGNLAEYIPERSRQEVIYSLKDLFHRKYRPVTRFEQIEGRKRFDWRVIVGGFWKRCF